MKITNIKWMFIAVLFYWILIAGDDDDPGPEPDDDPEGDCMKFHNCSGSQWGYCLERKGHDGLHLCTKCLTYFSDDD